MTPLRKRMIDAMTLAGLARSTQETYIQAVRSLTAHDKRSPDQLSEDEVRRYLLALRERGAARGTFKTSHYGIQFLYRQTLDCDWPLFLKKRFAFHGRSACRTPCPMIRAGVFWPVSAIPSTRPALP